MDYKERLADATSTYKRGLQFVRETPPPEGQKFPPGSFVKVDDKLRQSMSHFQSGVYARVEYTYAHAYPHLGGDHKSYCLLIRYPDGHWSTVAWYYEHQLQLLEDADKIAEFSAEIAALKAVEGT